MAPPSTFASAAAGNNAPSTPSRTDSGGGDWTRRQNGLTQTFRRPSLATNVSASNGPRDVSQNQNQTATPGVYVPPHRNGIAGDTRYSKSQLLDFYKAQPESELNQELPDLYMPGWEPSTANGVAAGAWSRRDDQSKDHAHGPEVCWDKDGLVGPVGLLSMSEEEKEIFASVNSPLKPPAQTTKEPATREASSRKISISHVNSPGAFGLNSPSIARPGARRRETQDAYPFPSSPSVAKSSRDESRASSPPPTLSRRKTDFKDSPAGNKLEASEDKPPEDAPDTARIPFGSVKRAQTGPLSAAAGAPASPWAATPQSGAFSPMGAFGNFAIGSNPAAAGTPTDKRPGLAGGRAESRFKGLMSKETEDGRSLKEKPSISNLGATGWCPQDHPTEDVGEDVPSGSAALGGGDDSDHERSDFGGMGTPSRQPSRDNFGFGAFGMTSDAPSFRGLMHQQQDQYHGTAQGRGQPQPQPQPQQQQQHPSIEPMSPTDTNPYQSPEHHGVEPEDNDCEGSDIQNVHLPGLGGFGNEGMPGLGGFGGITNLGRAPAVDPSDRSQTSSVGPQRGFHGLPGLGGLGALSGLGGAAAWGTNQGTIGTPSRERPGLATNFGDNVFGSSADMQSPNLAGLAGLGHSNFFNNASATGRGPSRLGSFLPAGMQEQMRSGSGMPQFGEDSDDHADFNMPRDTDSPFRHQGASGDIPGNNFADLRSRQEGHFGQFGIPGAQTPGGQDPIGARSMQVAGAMQAQPVSSSASNQPPAAQQKTMVMPDRMRWIYRDPQGNTQGPWSGLEMHDWYKAGFFSPELLVKKHEDPDYEPLAQLIRRIGNSREPFLVPQIGIPHGPASANPPTVWNGPLTVPASGAQPPFANSFPSFGTTLTADQQNALERRKQEEQYLMARQKEHLAQQQIAQKYQLQGQYGMLPQLHHHSSAQSLHSQPSFGNIASPTAYQQSPHQGPSQLSQQVPGFFDNSFRNGPIGGLGAGLGAVGAGVDLLGNIREEELPGMLERLNTGRQNQGQFGGISQTSNQEQQVAQMLNDRQKLQQEQDASQNFAADQSANNDRFLQFQGLQPDAHADPFNVASGGVIGKPKGNAAERRQQSQFAARGAEANNDFEPMEEGDELESELLSAGQNEQPASSNNQREHLSLTEQVQKAQSAKQSPAPQSAWAKIDTALPQPFPPAPSQSPLPAPAAQRSRANMAEALHAESHSRSQTPSVDTPSASIAPWAKEPAEASRGPSLKEIQEAEAKVAAQQEAVATEARRAALEKELMAQSQVIAPAPGLPSSSTWATASPASTSAVVSSAWAKAAPKAAATPSSAKTLAQIQKEEEARKKRQLASAAVAAAQNTAVANAALQSAGKRYADLASKVASPVQTPVMGSSAWTTVGASGKVKTPAPAPTPVAARVVSATVTPAAKKPIATKTAPTGSGAAVNAQDEFKKWAVNELKHDLNKGLQAEDFVSNLLALGSEPEIVMHAVHSVTQTIDSRHFAEEFLRRRKLADKGLVDATKANSPANAGVGQSGGWSEVAKKGPAKAAEDVAGGAAAVAGGGVGGNFKVVAPKKKVSKR